MATIDPRRPPSPPKTVADKLADLLDRESEIHGKALDENRDPTAEEREELNWIYRQRDRLTETDQERAAREAQEEASGKTGEEIDHAERAADAGLTPAELDARDQARRDEASGKSGEELDERDRNANDAATGKTGEELDADEGRIPTRDGGSGGDGTGGDGSGEGSGSGGGGSSSGGGGTGDGGSGGGGDELSDGGDDNPHGGQQFRPLAGGLPPRLPGAGTPAGPSGGPDSPHGGNPVGDTSADDPDGPGDGTGGHIVNRSDGGTLADRLAAADLHPPAAPQSDPRVTDPLEHGTATEGPI